VAACKIWLSSHIWATLLKSWKLPNAFCFYACYSTNSFGSWEDTAINKVWHTLTLLWLYCYQITKMSF
jgi:hypothetical protein